MCIFIRTLFTARSDISNVTRRTSAIRSVVINCTLGRFYARIIFRARVDTFSVYACPVARTICVGATTGDHTSYLSISRHSWRTFAHGLMVDSVTVSFRSTTATVCGAHGDTDPVDTNVLTRTIRFASASG